MNWKFFSRRRRITLESFLDGITSYDDAVAHFSKQGIDIPENDLLKKFFADKKKKLKKAALAKPAVVKLDPVVDNPVPNPKKDKKPGGKNEKKPRKRGSLARARKKESDEKK